MSSRCYSLTVGSCILFLHIIQLLEYPQGFQVPCRNDSQAYVTSLSGYTDCTAQEPIKFVKGGPYQYVNCGCLSGNHQQPSSLQRYIPFTNSWQQDYITEDQPRLIIKKKYKPNSCCSNCPFYSCRCPHCSNANKGFRTQTPDSWWDGTDCLSTSYNYQDHYPDCSRYYDLPKMCKYSDNYFTGSDGHLYCVEQDCCSCKKRFCRSCPNCLYTNDDRYRNSRNNLVNKQHWYPANFSPNTCCRMCCLNDCDKNCCQHTLCSNHKRPLNGCNRWYDHSNRKCNCDHAHCDWKIPTYSRQSGDCFGYSADYC